MDLSAFNIKITIFFSFTNVWRLMNNKSIETKWDDNPVDVSTEVNFIWSIANKLRGTYTSDKYRDVIIPMTIIRRIECALEPTKQNVIDMFEQNPDIPYQLLCSASKLSFYNTSRYSLKELLNDPDNIAANFKFYIQSFSSNINDIIVSLDFEKQIDKMDKNNRLYNVVKAFSDLDLNPAEIDNVKMGYIFEDLIRRFSENAEAGDHYTGRDIIKLMVSILLAEGCDDIFKEGKVITCLDQACGTGGMLSTCYNYIKRFNNSADVRMFGQETNPESYAICLAEMLIKGQDASNIRRADTFKEDCFPNIKMRFVLENPPFGTPWGGKDAPDGDEVAVREENKKGFDGRFGAGLPSTSDGQLLFVESAVNKLDEKKGRAAIIENGSPLFTGGTSSGESQIRRWLLEQDLLEVIIALPTDLFYNTGIATYIWIISKNKAPHRKGKVQLIDATTFCHKLRKALGNKKNEISAEDRATITKLYAEFDNPANGEYCKIFDNEDFIYREYTVMQPLQRSYAINDERINDMLNKGTLDKIYSEAKVFELENAEEELSAKELKKLNELKAGQAKFEQILSLLREHCSASIYLSKTAFMPVITGILQDVCDKKLIESIADSLSVMDKSAEIQKDKKGNVLYDPETKDIEIVNIKENIDDYMQREVLPFVPDAKAFFEENLTAKKLVIKTGAEIPFTRFFYKYEEIEKQDKLKAEIRLLEIEIETSLKSLFK